ncbi:MAG TPA: ATP-binding protein [Bryobacteraceae bacterium]|nr:ATP-binding protein [Bryobacteraceae bacterium]
MQRLRDRLIVLFLIATLVPLAATLWLTTSLLDRSLRYATTRELDEISRALEKTGREYYQLSRESLKREALAGQLPPERYVAATIGEWPEPVRQFWESGQAERFYLSGAEGNRLNYLARRGDGVLAWSRPLGSVAMERLRRQYQGAREVVDAGSGRDLRRGFILTFLALALGTWVLSLALLVFFAARVSRPIHSLTEGLSRLASGEFSARVSTGRDDEVGHAIRAFNHMAERLESQRARLVYLTQLASWQALARKMAHELKNSLTPIRLTMEEVQARAGEADGAFPVQAAEIVIDEVESLERRVRAFSEFAAEPPVHPRALDLNSAVEERTAFLRGAHPEVIYEQRLAPGLPPADADADLVRGILTNLLENAAEAAGEGGKVLIATLPADEKLAVEVHDSGPGLTELARKSLFEPTISFKKHGMGLGLSIARKSALLAGGDILLVRGELGGAGFRVVLPQHVTEPHPDR